MQRPYALPPVLLAALAFGGSGFERSAFAQGGADFQGAEVGKEAEGPSNAWVAAETRAPRSAPRAGAVAPAKELASAKEFASAKESESAKGRARKSDASPASDDAAGTKKDSGKKAASVPSRAAHRGDLMRLSEAGVLRATVELLDHPELMYGAAGVRWLRWLGVPELGSAPPPAAPTAPQRALRRTLYDRLLVQAPDPATLESLDVLGRLRADYAAQWLGADQVLGALVGIEHAHGPVTLGRRARLGRAQWIASLGCGLDRADAAAARLFQSLVFAPEPDIASAAQHGLWRLIHLRPGRPAPTLAGIDAEGNEIRLRSFVGRVVLLRFWSLAHDDVHIALARDARLERRMGDHPFSLIGVNRDADRGEYLRHREEMRFPGIQIYEGPCDESLVEEVRDRRASRPNAFDAWRESGDSHTYLIDAEGRLRAIDPCPEQLEALTRALLQERYESTRLLQHH